MAVIITLPALLEVNIGTEEAPIIVPTAFYAVVSVAVIGLYLAFLVPIYLRWRAGDKFKQGPWNLGNKWKWMAPVACLEIVDRLRLLHHAVHPGRHAGLPAVAQRLARARRRCRSTGSS